MKETKYIFNNNNRKEKNNGQRQWVGIQEYRKIVFITETYLPHAFKQPFFNNLELESIHSVQLNIDIGIYLSPP